jgi:hypothetical protein
MFEIASGLPHLEKGGAYIAKSMPFVDPSARDIEKSTKARNWVSTRADKHARRARVRRRRTS